MTLDPAEVALRSLLNQPDTVIFVGSGLSLWSGLPTWESLLRHLIQIAAAKGRRTQIAEEALASKQLLEAADALQLTAIEIATALHTQIGFSAARPHEIHALLVRLGPQRFVTTNYDSLIEQQLGLDGRLGSFRTITGRQVAELADIVKASADTFVFKPHGDLSDAESIVLTTRDYERVISGERNQVRRTLETLLVTRPVLFIGYGLRDPDTGLVLRTIHDRYLGTVANFTAVVADATEEHISYWWDRYRIRVHAYETKPGISGARDHSALLTLLRRVAAAKDALDSRSGTSNGPLYRNLPLGSGGHGDTQPIPSGPTASGDPTALIRYAARLIKPEPARDWPIQVQLTTWPNRRVHAPEIEAFAHANLADVLDKCPGSFIVTGSAGSGKSFAFARFLSRTARQLIAWNSEQGTKPPHLPVLLDARLYEGSFERLVSQTVPSQLDLVAASRAHEILVVLDSLDEMPVAHLDAARWRADLDGLLGQFGQARIIFGTRRPDLVGRSALPTFRIGELRLTDLREELAELGLSLDSYPEEFRWSLGNPFLLSLARRFLARRPYIRSAAALLGAFLSDRIALLPDRLGHQDFLAKLRATAAQLIDAGRETMPIDDLPRAPVSQRSNGTVRIGREIVDGLVSVGIMTSEIDAHVRFVHRTVTEYLASEYVASAWRDGRLNLGDKLSTRRWDNSIAWAAGTLDADEAACFVRAVYDIDPQLAGRIIVTAEINRTRLWSTLLDLLEKHPPQEEPSSYIYWEIEAPLEVADRLRLFATKREFIGGWAAALYFSHANDDDLRDWINSRIAQGKVDYNHATVSGPALGRRLDGVTFEYFLSVLGSTKFKDAYDAQGNEIHQNLCFRYGFESVINGLTKDNFGFVLEWGARQSKMVRGVICDSLVNENRPGTIPFLCSQVDRKVPEAIFALYLKLRFNKRQVATLFPFKKARLAIILNDALTPRKKVSWGFALLLQCAQADPQWLRGVDDAAKNVVDPALRRALKAFSPSSSAKAKQRYIARVLRGPGRASMIELKVVSVLEDEGITIPEDIILDAIRTRGVSALKPIEDFFESHSSSRILITAERVDDWINLLQSAHPLSERRSAADVMGRVLEYIGAVFSHVGRSRVLARANDPHDPAQEFILANIVPRMQTVTTDDLTPRAALLMLNLFLRWEPDLWRSPGSIATEHFITEVVMPLAKSIPREDSRWPLMKRILEEAGLRHDRRYFAAPIVTER